MAFFGRCPRSRVVSSLPSFAVSNVAAVTSFSFRRYNAEILDENINIAGPCKRFNNDSKMSIVGVPINMGQPKAGTSRGPNALREAGLIGDLRDKLGWNVCDLGDVPVDNRPSDDVWGKIKHPIPVGKANEETFKIVSKAASEGDVVVTMGGDHSLATGSVGGILKARPEVAVIWVDAHADINTVATTLSGNLHGMPVSQLMKLPDTEGIPGFEWMSEVPTLRTNRIAYIGLRDVDRGERAILRKYGIRAFSMHDVDKFGIGKVLFLAMQHVNPMRNRIFHLSFDIDAVDPHYAPSTGTTVPGGLTFREAHYIAEAMGATGMLGSMDIVEVNPFLGGGTAQMKTIELGKDLVLSAFGNLPL